MPSSDEAMLSESSETKGQSGGKSTDDMADELESAKMYIDLLQRQLQTAQNAAKKASQASTVLQTMERERDRYRAVCIVFTTYTFTRSLTSHFLTHLPSN